MPNNTDPNNAIILVVEDDEVSYILIREILKPLEIKTIRAKSKEEVLMLVNSDEDFRLIVMDVFLSGSENGYTIASELADMQVDLPIIIISAYTSSVLLPERKIVKNIKEVMDKPFDVNRFKKVLLESLKN
jgi:CheY-like chemotaxis protein